MWKRVSAEQLLTPFLVDPAAGSEHGIFIVRVAMCGLGTPWRHLRNFLGSKVSKLMILDIDLRVYLTSKFESNLNQNRVSQKLIPSYIIKLDEPNRLR